MKSIKTNTFCGIEVSKYGQEHGYVDYGTLAKTFDAVLNNSIFSLGWDLGEWEIENGFTDHEEEIEELREKIEELEDLITEESSPEHDDEITDQIRELEEEIEELENDDPYNYEVFQWFIIDEAGADQLKYWTNELVYYNDALEIYLWGVTHFGTSWSYVLTDIRIEA